MYAVFTDIESVSDSSQTQVVIGPAATFRMSETELYASGEKEAVASFDEEDKVWVVFDPRGSIHDRAYRAVAFTTRKP